MRNFYTQKHETYDALDFFAFENSFPFLFLARAIKHMRLCSSDFIGKRAYRALDGKFIDPDF